MAQAPAPSGGSPQPGHSLITTTAMELIGLFALTLLAGVNDNVGSIMVLLMVGFLLGWLFLHGTELSSITKNL